MGRYRYGFNGKEKDDEVKGAGDQIDYGMRVYDPLAGRFLSVDPLTKTYPWYTPYQYAGNKPVWKRYVDGLEEEDAEEGREEREELLRRADQIRLGQALRSPTAEEEARSRKEFEEQLKETPQQRAARAQRFINGLNNYTRNGFGAAEDLFAGPKMSGMSLKQLADISHGRILFHY